jgi:glycerol-3-phosphate acyltransferase PlsY
MVVASLLLVVGAYLLGSIRTGYLLVRIFRKQDIRTMGSGNMRRPFWLMWSRAALPCG